MPVIHSFRHPMEPEGSSRVVDDQHLRPDDDTKSQRSGRSFNILSTIKNSSKKAIRTSKNVFGRLQREMKSSDLTFATVAESISASSGDWAETIVKSFSTFTSQDDAEPYSSSTDYERDDDLLPYTSSQDTNQNIGEDNNFVDNRETYSYSEDESSSEEDESDPEFDAGFGTEDSKFRSQGSGFDETQFDTIFHNVENPESSDLGSWGENGSRTHSLIDQMREEELETESQTISSEEDDMTLDFDEETFNSMNQVDFFAELREEGGINIVNDALYMIRNCTLDEPEDAADDDGSYSVVNQHYIGRTRSFSPRPKGLQNRMTDKTPKVSNNQRQKEILQTSFLESMFSCGSVL